MTSFSIQTRTLANGESRFKATVTVKKNSLIIHREAKTFKKKELARTWAKNKTSELEEFGVNNEKTCSIANELDLFMDDHNLWVNTGRTKQYVIKMLLDCDVTNVQSNQLKTSINFET